jgi:hypothetical protein
MPVIACVEDLHTLNVECCAQAFKELKPSRPLEEAVQDLSPINSNVAGRRYD